MRARVEVERSGWPIRPIARPCCDVTTGRGCRTRECKANALHRDDDDILAHPSTTAWSGRMSPRLNGFEG